MNRPKAGFELREHTADIALYVWADTLPALFAAATRGLYAAIGEIVPQGVAKQHEVSLQAGDVADLLGDLLTELLYTFETSGSILTDPVVDVSDDGRQLRVCGRLCPVDHGRTVFDREVKAVTRHNLHIEQGPGGFETTVILDI